MNEKGLIAKAFGQLILVLAGGMIGVVGNQIFFERNKKFEISMELQKDFVQQQLPLYNRILNLTYLQINDKFTKIISKKTMDRRYDPFGLIYAIDTTYQRDTFSFLIPTFVSDTSMVMELRKDLAIIGDNKDKIDPTVWEHVARLLLFFNSHPIPSIKTPEALSRCTWADTLNFKTWQQLNTRLYFAAKDKLSLSLL